MGFEKCISEVSSALGRELTDDEAIDLFENIQRRVKKAKDQPGSFDEATRKSKEQMIEEEKTARFVKKRQAYLSYKARINLLDYIDSNFPKEEILGLQSYMVGSQRNRTASKSSIAAQILAYHDQMLSAMTGDLKGANLEKVFLSGEFDLELARALHAISRKEELPYTGPKDVMELARIVKKYQDVMVKDLNGAGANIGLYEGYIVRNSHDAYKIGDVTPDVWKKDILERLDIDRTFEGRNIDETLDGIYKNLKAGTHYKVPDKITGFKGGSSNIGRRVSEERFFHWKSPDDWYEYNKKYGYGNISQAVFRQMGLTSRNVILMQKLGPNPRDTLNKVVEYIKARKTTDEETVSKLEKSMDEKHGALIHQYSEISGATQMVQYNLAAKIGTGARIFNAVTQLGGALITSLSDIGGIITHMKYLGFDLFDGLEIAITGLAKGRQADELAKLNSSLGVTFKSIIEDISRIGYADDNGPGTLSKMANLYFKYNGLNWWTETLTAAGIRGLSNLYALERKLTFDQLNNQQRLTLNQFNIDSDKWDMARQTAEKAADGKEYIMPDRIGDLPDQVFAEYLQKKGIKPNERLIKEEKKKIELEWVTFFSENSRVAVLQPDALTRSMMQRGFKKGSLEREVLDFLGQYKSFPMAFVQKVMGREVYGRGANSVSEAMRNKNGELFGLANVFLISTIFGYASMNLKAILAGKSPRNPDSGFDYYKLVMAAMAQGGGAGLYGDFLFGEMKSRYGAGPLDSLLGPTFGKLSSVADLFGRVKNGDDLAASTFKFAMSNVPGNNLWWAKIPLDYAITYRVQEMLNPGALKRMEQRIKKENDQTYLFPPSQVIR